MAVIRHGIDEATHPVSTIPSRADRRGDTVAASFESEGARRLAAIYEVSKVLTASFEPGESVRMVLNILASFVELRHGVVALLVEPEGSLDDAPDGALVNPYVIAATVASAQPQSPNADILPANIVNGVLRTSMPILVQNVQAEMPGLAERNWIGGVENRVSLLAVPIQVSRSDWQAMGVLCVYRIWDPDVRVKLDDDLRFLMMVATLIGHSLRLKKLVADDRERLIRESNELRKALDDAAGTAEAAAAASVVPADIVGDSPQIRDVVERIRKVAPTRSTVLLRGESGTGKELFARAVHMTSSRADRPFVKVNCAALSESLLESELFGHEKGAFTGASAQRKGRFELAEGGTLFLDEIGEISTTFQVKLLRVLQEGEFERVGGTKTIKVDVRLVAATNRNLEEAVASGAFRADLYYRICVVPIMLPPLRDRPGDIPLLAKAFLTRFNRENGTALRFANEAVNTLQGCYFPGNVRELENCVNRVAALAPGPEITAVDLACMQGSCLSSQVWSTPSRGPGGPIGGLAVPPGASLPVLNQPAPCAAARPGGGPAACAPMPQATDAGQPDPDIGPRDALVDAMERSGWVQAKAARLLGMTPRQIGYALRKHNVEIKKF